ncbi:MAG: UDP-2,3-diacylglucosamine diphosphatase [Geminicoccaceae bacterium]|nr:MAG: UDP-2,3-diacylglucosamine diphosphatase [Geminicoccaceae bacterium]
MLAPGRPRLSRARGGVAPVIRTATQRVRAVFVSDLHLGYKGADIRALNTFLASHAFDALYLVGDIVDGWKLETRWYWNRDYTDLLDLLLHRRRQGARITLLTGNHDEKLRAAPATSFRAELRQRFGIEVEERAIHRTQDGRRLLVLHGDQFDGALFRNTSKWADRAWSWLGENVLASRPATRPADLGTGSRWSLGKAIATNAKWLASGYNEAGFRHAALTGVDGLVCGHSHVPGLWQQGALTLANCGSWTGATGPAQRHTAIVETLDGHLQRIDWPAMRRAHGDPTMRPLPPHDPGTDDALTSRLVRLVHALWNPPILPWPQDRGRPVGKAQGRLMAARTPARPPTSRRSPAFITVADPQNTASPRVHPPK